MWFGFMLLLSLVIVNVKLLRVITKPQPYFLLPSIAEARMIDVIIWSISDNFPETSQSVRKSSYIQTLYMHHFNQIHVYCLHLSYLCKTLLYKYNFLYFISKRYSIHQTLYLQFILYFYHIFKFPLKDWLLSTRHEYLWYRKLSNSILSRRETSWFVFIPVHLFKNYQNIVGLNITHAVR